MGEVIELHNRTETGEPYVSCPCGEAWFELEGLVVRGVDGRITGYSGAFVCSACGSRT